MISTHYMQEIQKDHERNIESAIKTQRYIREQKNKPAQPGFFTRTINSTGSVLINIGNRLQCFAAFRQAKV